MVSRISLFQMFEWCFCRWLATPVDLRVEARRKAGHGGDDEFKPRLGSIGDAGKASTPRYLGRVLAAVNLARGGAARKGGKGAFSGSRTGRGHGVGRVLASRSGQGGLHARRVIVKASIIMMTGRGCRSSSAYALSPA
jgi:hypothetical protein